MYWTSVTAEMPCLWNKFNNLDLIKRETNLLILKKTFKIALLSCSGVGRNLAWAFLLKSSFNFKIFQIKS